MNGPTFEVSTLWLFLGYPRLELWAGAVSEDQMVYASKIVESKTIEHGATMHSQFVEVSQPDSRNIIHYCRLDAAQVTTIGDQPFAADLEVRELSHSDLWQHVCDWLDENGFTIREARFDRSLHFTSIRGRASFINWDEKLSRFVRTDKALYSEHPATTQQASEVAP